MQFAIAEYLRNWKVLEESQNNLEVLYKKIKEARYRFI